MLKVHVELEDLVIKGERDIPDLGRWSVDCQDTHEGTDHHASLTDEQFGAILALAVGGPDAPISQSAKEETYELTKDWPVQVLP
ncbi:MAG: hypothetical protein HS116_21250 [Planctomycetes bacterium]|nr:hypothetical protein [Planctomycetota bacterium]